MSSCVPLVRKRDDPCCFFWFLIIFFTDDFLVNGSRLSFAGPDVPPWAGIFFVCPLPLPWKINKLQLVLRGESSLVVRWQDELSHQNGGEFPTLWFSAKTVKRKQGCWKHGGSRGDCPPSLQKIRHSLIFLLFCPDFVASAPAACCPNAFFLTSLKRKTGGLGFLD